jgi:ParB-like chromosome segregation protein Spo0J
MSYIQPKVKKTLATLLATVACFILLLASVSQSLSRSLRLRAASGAHAARDACEARNAREASGTRG